MKRCAGEEVGERSTIKYDKTDYSVTMGFLKKSVIEPGVSKLPSLIKNYIMKGVRSPSPEILNCLTEAVGRRCL